MELNSIINSLLAPQQQRSAKNLHIIPIVGYAGKFFCVLSPNQQLPSISLSVFIIRNDSDDIVT